MPRVFLEISGSGDLVTENYDWGACEKAVFYWTGSPLGRGGNLFVMLHKVGTEGRKAVVIKTVYEPFEGQTLQALLGGLYYFAITAPEVSWTIRGECQDLGTTATTPTLSEFATPNRGIGGCVAFVSGLDGNPEIYVMNADGIGVTRLTDNPNWDGMPARSPR